MITRTYTERIGEYLGPIDWDYDFAQHDWHGSRGGVNPEITAASRLLLKKLETDLNQNRECKVWIYGIRHQVIKVGMYDGFPFWKPTPSICVDTHSGVEWHPWYKASE